DPAPRAEGDVRRSRHRRAHLEAPELALVGMDRAEEPTHSVGLGEDERATRREDGPRRAVDAQVRDEPHETRLQAGLEREAAEGAAPGRPDPLAARVDHRVLER